ncbi:MAG: DNA cytosine methyltransferase [Alishewanella aestuarii]
MTGISQQGRKPTFIDVFSGCGGLSLGLMQSGWQGIFAIEKTHDAFLTLKYNLIDGERYKFDWPNWLPKENMEVQSLLTKYRSQLEALEGQVDLIAGGPPCQGFSNAGKRDPNDPRNLLAEQYIEVVKIVKPQFLLLENVRGFNSKFEKSGNPEDLPYSQIVKKKLEGEGYGVAFTIVTCSDWGVPQRRPRFIMIAKRGAESASFEPFKAIDEFRDTYLKGLGLSTKRPVSVKEAIQDLEVEGKRLILNTESRSKKFMELAYEKPKSLNRYLKIIREGHSKAPNSLRLPKHSDVVRERFALILKECPKGTSISDDYRAKLSTKKRTLTPLHPDMPSATVTTLPDDMVHYSEPRILTVRESARLQSFPDWYEFHGVYTTGGKRRKFTCPRYTQVGNAVPPLLSRALGLLLQNHL